MMGQEEGTFFKKKDSRVWKSDTHGKESRVHCGVDHNGNKVLTKLGDGTPDSNAGLGLTEAVLSVDEKCKSCPRT